MDLVRAWGISLVIYLGLNFLFGYLIGYAAHYIYLLVPLVAGIGASAFHAEWGVGGWVRHLLAVIPVPSLVMGYGVFSQDGAPGSVAEFLALMSAFGMGAVLSLLGMGAVMLTRLLLAVRAE